MLWLTRNWNMMNPTTGDLSKSPNLSHASMESSPSKMPELDANCLAKIEREATLLAKDFYHLNKKLQESLNTISAASVCSLQTYQETINKNCELVNENLKEENLFLIKAKVRVILIIN